MLKVQSLRQVHMLQHPSAYFPVTWLVMVQVPVQVMRRAPTFMQPTLNWNYQSSWWYLKVWISQINQRVFSFQKESTVTKAQRDDHSSHSGSSDGHGWHTMKTKTRCTVFLVWKSQVKSGLFVKVKQKKYSQAPVTVTGKMPQLDFRNTSVPR